MKKKALFLDRDGTLIVDKHYLKNPNNVELIPGAKDFIYQAKAFDYLLFLFTNQSGIGRGYHTKEDTIQCNDRMFQLMNLNENYFTKICIAPELPSDPQIYRKPSPRFILEMIEAYNLDPQQCWMIGDHLNDLKTGINAGIRSAWVQTGKPLDVEKENYIQKHNIIVLSKLKDVFNII